MGECCVEMGRMRQEEPKSRPSLVVLAGGLAKRYGGCKPLAPVGLHGEAVIDLTASDAREAGFGDVVLVLGPQTGAAITYHVRRCWPSSVPVDFAVQEVPLGTAHAVLCARRLLPDGPFAVVNADDVYGARALALLARHLERRPAGEEAEADGAGMEGRDDAEHFLVAFAIRNTIVSADPVTRGTCVVGPGSRLEGIVERRKVTKGTDGRFISEDGLEPVEISGDTPVSVNLWGFGDSIWGVLEAAVTEAHPGVAPDGTVRRGAAVETDHEVLLPEVVGDVVAGKVPGGGPAQEVQVLQGPGRCLGVTHSEDLPIVRGELAALVGQGLRPEGVFEFER